jgi:CHAT domain-containing protein
MASSPRDQHELDFEAEEAAILRAVGETSLDLLVEDTGDPGQLARRLAGTAGMPVVHLSCHGLHNWRRRPGEPGVPVLWMEDEAGGGRPVTAGELAGLLTSRPRLVFVSACLTATDADATGHQPPGNGRKGQPGDGAAGGVLVAHSLATALVEAGFPGVLGWDGSVDDQAATLFAGRLYRVWPTGRTWRSRWAMPAGPCWSLRIRWCGRTGTWPGYGSARPAAARW